MNENGTMAKGQELFNFAEKAQIENRQDRRSYCL